MASASESKAAPSEGESPSAVSTILNEIIYSPVNLLLTAIIALLLYKILKSRFGNVHLEPPVPELPKLRKDMTVAELRQYDGTQPDGRVLVAVNGWIFDVTRGRRFYGPGGPYAAFGGKDASRGLATFSVTSSDKEYDDLSDLNSMEMESVKEWDAQFRELTPEHARMLWEKNKGSLIMDIGDHREKYELVGRLLKPGEEPTNYSDEETEETDNSTNNADKKEK